MANVNNKQFRGLGVEVSPLDSTEDMLAKSGLNWKTVPLPMLIQGRTENRPSQFKSLVRSDDGHELGCCTNEYRPIHNVQIVDAMKRIADAGDMTITSLGSLNHGERVFASVKMQGEFNIDPIKGELTPERALAIHGQSWDSISPEDRTRLDTTELHGIMGTGHVPGMAFTFEGWAERLVCLNGAKISRSAKSRFSLRHVTEFDRDAQIRFAECVREIRTEFLKYRDSALRLRGQKWDNEVTRAFCCELLAPSFFAKALELGVGAGVRPSLVETVKSGYSLESVLNKTAAYLGAGVIDRQGEDKIKITRPASQVLELMNTQPGADLAAGTAWNAVNAVTYYVDHVRGRGESSAVESALFGQGATLKQDALELALSYTEALWN